MALFKRADLEKLGLNKEQVDWVMTEGNRSLAANYTLTSDVQGKIDAAVQAAQQATPEADPKTSKEYLDLLNERDMLRAIGGDDFASVKPKFRETVFGMLDRTEKALPVADQLKAIGEKYEEYFTPAQDPKDTAPKNTPQYSRDQGRTGVNNTSPEDELFEKLKENWK